MDNLTPDGQQACASRRGAVLSPLFLVDEDAGQCEDDAESDASPPVLTAELVFVTQDVSALQLLVPEAERLLDAVRGVVGVGLLEPAHVSLGYPWRTAEAADPSVVQAAAACTRAFQVRLTEVRTFPPDGRGRVLVRAAPDDDEPFHELARVVQSDLRQVHLSVARVVKEGDVVEVVRRVELLLPLVATVRLLELTAQRGGVWQPGRRFALTGERR